MDVTDDGIVTLVSEEQFWNAYLLIKVTEDGMSTLVIERHP